MNGKQTKDAPRCNMQYGVKQVESKALSLEVTAKTALNVLCCYSKQVQTQTHETGKEKIRYIQHAKLQLKTVSRFYLTMALT